MKLKTSHLISSLVFPILTIVLSMYFSEGIIDLPLEKMNIWEIALVLTPWVGGVLPIILTLLFNIDTSKYIIDRFIILFVSGLICLIGINAFSNSLAIYMIIVALVLLLNIVYFFCRIRNFSKFLLVTLSNPIIYYPILFMDFITHLSEEMFSGFRM